MNKLSPTVEEIEALRKSAPPGPVVMVNLLKFKPDGGREAYFKYIQAATPAAPKGMRIVYSGKAGADVLKSAPEDALGMWPVSRRVNKVGNDNDPTLIEAI